MWSRPKLWAKKALAPVLYRHRPIGLSAGKLYLYLDALYRTREISGAILEIGCNLCGTACVGRQMLRKLGVDKCYVAVDTFGGFVDSQFSADVETANISKDRTAFSSNDIHLARKILRQHGCDDVSLIQADIVRLETSLLPDPISVALLDVDLARPTRAALDKVWERMSPGGVILVDDIGVQAGSWKAGTALEEFTRERQLSYRLEFGMGILNVPLEASG